MSSVSDADTDMDESVADYATPIGAPDDIRDPANGEGDEGSTPEDIDDDEDENADDTEPDEDGDAVSGDVDMEDLLAGEDGGNGEPSEPRQPFLFVAGDASSSSSQPAKRLWRRLDRPSRDIDLIQNPPSHLAAMRQTLFEMKDSVELKPEEFNTFWPFVDNVWVRIHRSHKDRGDGVTTEYYACRLQRPTHQSKTSEPQRRRKQVREGGTCKVRIKALHYHGPYEKITLRRSNEHTHSHDLDLLDQMKRNTAVMDIARTEVAKGHDPLSVFKAMGRDPEKMALVGGKYMRTNDVRNACMAWRKDNPDVEFTAHPDAGKSWKYMHKPGPARLKSRTKRNATTPVVSAPRVVPIPAAPPPRPLVVKTAREAPLPIDTLFFPDPNAEFLRPYLPPRAIGAPEPSGSQMPHVTLTYATSMDSLLSIDPRFPTPISSLPTKAMTHYLRARHEAILIGVGTAIADDPTLNCRIAGAGGYGGVGWRYHPRPVIVDPGARWEIHPGSKILLAAKDGRGCAPWIIVQPNAQIPPARIELVKSYGGKFLMLPHVDERFRLRWGDIFRALYQEGIKSVMVEGGATVITELLGREELRPLVTSALVTVAPTYLGHGGVRVGPERQYDHFGRPVAALRFVDVRWHPLGDDVVMCGRTPEWMDAHRPVQLHWGPPEGYPVHGTNGASTQPAASPAENATLPSPANALPANSSVGSQPPTATPSFNDGLHRFRATPEKVRGRPGRPRGSGDGGRGSKRSSETTFAAPDVGQPSSSNPTGAQPPDEAQVTLQEKPSESNTSNDNPDDDNLASSATPVSFTHLQQPSHASATNDNPSTPSTFPHHAPPSTSATASTADAATAAAESSTTALPATTTTTTVTATDPPSSTSTPAQTQHENQTSNPSPSINAIPYNSPGSMAFALPFAPYTGPPPAAAGLLPPTGFYKQRPLPPPAPPMYSPHPPPMYSPYPSSSVQRGHGRGSDITRGGGASSSSPSGPPPPPPQPIQWHARPDQHWTQMVSTGARSAPPTPSQPQPQPQPQPHEQIQAQEDLRRRIIGDAMARKGAS